MGNCISDRYLMKYENDTEEFTIKGKHRCKVVNIYDGDTCKIVMKFNGTYKRFNVRMEGYDSPEMKPLKSKKNRDKEIEAAKAAKEYLRTLVQKDGNQLVYINCNGFDKYGRLLGSLYVKRWNKKSVNQEMIDKNHGYTYNGGTKKDNFI